MVRYHLTPSLAGRKLFAVVVVVVIVVVVVVVVVVPAASVVVVVVVGWLVGWLVVGWLCYESTVPHVTNMS